MARRHQSAPLDLNTAAGRRAFFLGVLRRRARPGTGSPVSALRSRESHLVADLRALLHGVRFVVVGGTATSLYMAWRFTKDVDVLVSAESLPAVEDALRRAGASPMGPLPFAGGDLDVRGQGWALADGSLLDVLSSREPWVKEALAYPNRDASGTPIVALPYLVLLKLDASRTQDLSDISRMLGAADDAALAEVRTAVGRHLPDALDDLEGFIEIGRLEYQSAPEQAPEHPVPSPTDTAGEAASRPRRRRRRRDGRSRPS